VKPLTGPRREIVRARPAKDGRRRWDGGIAAVEFAIAVPFILIMIGGIADTGMLIRAKLRLTQAVSAATRYAAVAGASVASSTVSSIVQGVTALSGVQATVTGPGCYCSSGPSSAFVAATCGAACTIGGNASSYLVVQATYTYRPITPGYSHIVSHLLSEQGFVRLK
jgi:Flp pilus assembly protein TadG